MHKCLAALVMLTCSALAVMSPAFSQPAQLSAEAAAGKRVGTLKSVSGNTLTLSSDSGAQFTVSVDANARVVRVEPGQKSLKEATPIQLSDLQPGDRILVRGKPGDNATTLLASLVIAMKRSDIEARQQQEREAWQTHGVGGLVRSVDPINKTVTLSTGARGGTSVLIRTTAATSFRRYAPDSVKFDDAKPGTFADVRPGDQLRARGTRTSDGEFSADAIVSGTFRNIAGTVSSADPSTATVSVVDLATKSPITIKISSDSTLRRLPEPMAQHIAMRLHGGAPSGAVGTEGRPTSPASSASQASQTANAGEPQAGAPGESQPRRGGGMDFQRMLQRMQPITLTDLHRGDAVMIVATEGTPTSTPTAITVLTGVEPILTAAPKGGNAAAALLSPWNMGGQAGEGGEQ